MLRGHASEHANEVVGSAEHIRMTAEQPAELATIVINLRVNVSRG